MCHSLCILANLSKAKSCISATALFILTLKLKLYASKDGCITRGPVITTIIIIIIIHLFIYLFMCWSVCMEWCYVCVRFMWQLDWDCIWHQLGDGSCYCAAPRNSGSWATAIPDVYCSPEPSHQSKMSLFQTSIGQADWFMVTLCKLIFGDYPDFILTRLLAILLEDFHDFTQSVKKLKLYVETQLASSMSLHFQCHGHIFKFYLTVYQFRHWN
jgi:hypothetical protein